MRVEMRYEGALAGLTVRNHSASFSTPFASITRIRFEGFRASAQSQPLKRSSPRKFHINIRFEVLRRQKSTNICFLILFLK